MALAAEDITNMARLSGSDLIIAYGPSHIHQYVADNDLQIDGSHWIWEEQCARYVIHCYSF
jgi:hypothetical protein